MIYFHLISLWASFLIETSVAESHLFVDRQWGLHNSGQILYRPNGELTRRALVGIPGLDINWQKVTDPNKTKVVVAVIDSGLDVYHPALRDRIWRHPDCPDDLALSQCAGYNFLARNFDVSDDTGHGTHVAGIIASTPAGGFTQGVSNSAVQIMPLKVLSREVNAFVYQGRLITDIIAEALAFARMNGADVVNMSLGWPEVVQTPRFLREVQATLDANIPIVVAAGNNRKEVVTYPCTLEGVICVGAIENTAQMADFSNYGHKVDLLAPGEQILSLHPMNLESRQLRVNGMEIKRGTSQAAPYVTGVIADMISLSPELTLGEVRKRLFQSARQLEQVESKSLYGLVQHQGALTYRGDSFVELILKNLQEVVVDEKGHFSIDIPIKNWMEHHHDIQLSVDFQQEEVTLFQNQKTFSLDGEQKKVITFSGQIANLDIESHVPLNIQLIKDGQGHFEKTITLMFSLDLSQREKLFKRPFLNQSLGHASLDIRPGQSLSRLSLVDDPHQIHPGVEFFLARSNARDEKTLIHLVQVKDESLNDELVLELPLVQRVLSIKRGSFQDRPFYFVYSQKDSSSLLLSFFDQDGHPFYHHSHWKMPITQFGGLPVESGKHNFVWKKLNTQFEGDVIVPAFKKSYFLPEADNSPDPLDALSVIRRDHIFYMMPEMNEHGEVITSARVVDNAHLRNRFRDDFRLFYRDEINIMNTLYQDTEQMNTGVISFVISYGPAFNQSLLEVKYSDFNEIDFYSVTNNQGIILQGNAKRNAVEMASGNQFPFYSMMTLFDQQRMRSALLRRADGVKETSSFESQFWSDQIFDVMANYLDENYWYQIIESRYHIYLNRFSLNGERERDVVSALPINRDSAFPGVQFAEMFSPLQIFYRGQWRPAVYSNARLIFGNRIYTMLFDNQRQQLTRPLALSWQIPASCVPLNVNSLGRKDGVRRQKVLFHCHDASQNRIVIASYPLDEIVDSRRRIRLFMRFQ